MSQGEPAGATLRVFVPKGATSVSTFPVAQSTPPVSREPRRMEGVFGVLISTSGVGLGFQGGERIC